MNVILDKPHYYLCHGEAEITAFRLSTLVRKMNTICSTSRGWKFHSTLTAIAVQQYQAHSLLLCLGYRAFPCANFLVVSFLQPIESLLCTVRSLQFRTKPAALFDRVSHTNPERIVPSSHCLIVSQTQHISFARYSIFHTHSPIVQSTVCVLASKPNDRPRSASSGARTHV